MIHALALLQATLHLSAAAPPAGAAIHAAGTFNDWNPADSAFILRREPDGAYAVTLPASIRGPIEFKFTLGSWETVELDGTGGDVANHRFTIPDTGAATWEGTVPEWRRGGPRPRPAPSATASVDILDTAFVMPQLEGRSRRVWIYLPPGYHRSRRRYPVLYLQDGQNLFDASTAFAGEWGVDETLDSLRARGDSGVIVVGVDNGGQRRMDEYSPWRNPKYGGGAGDRYVDFLVGTLKPYIDRHYRTLRGRAHTGVGGSSMGGLISLYAALRYPEVFGRALVFSPSLWFSPDVFSFARHARHVPGTRIAILMGGREGEAPERNVADLRRLVDTLRADGFRTGDEVEAVIRPDGAHAEWFWRREFPAAYRWLFAGGDFLSAPAWTRGAVCYEIFVRSFYDSNGDGIGDLNGLIEKLDYVAGLGASCIWLMPVARSPSYHGYDVSDYYTVEPDYGTNADFQRLVAAAHARGIEVLVDMVLNHTSRENPWFQAALRDTASPYRHWYRFSPTPGGKGPWGEEAWHRSPVREEYYYGVFWSGMPDLDYHTPAVRREAMKIAGFWLKDMGVDGFRLDAVPYLSEQGSCLVGCPGTHAFLREYAAHVDSVKPGAYTVGEVWGNIATLLPYYPDQLTSYFGFELADTMLAVVRSGRAAGLLAPFLRLQDTVPQYRWSPILSNHDGTRSMTLLGGDLARAKLAATLLLTLPGLPFVYYGEEIGMTGDKPDPRLRTPMQWSPTSGVGFTTGTPWETPQPDSMTVNVAVEDSAPGSLLDLYRRLIHLRKSNEALADGRLVALSTGNSGVAAYLRRAGDHAVLVVVNLGGSAVSRLAIRSAAGALPAGRYTPTDLLSGTRVARLRVGADGRIAGYVPAATLGARQALVLDLVSSANLHHPPPTSTILHQPPPSSTVLHRPPYARILSTS